MITGQVVELSKLVCCSLAKEETSISRQRNASGRRAGGKYDQGLLLFEEETPPTNLPSERSVVLSYVTGEG